MTASTSFIHVFEPGTDASAPPLLLLHGTGGNEHDLIALGRQLSPGSALLSPRGRVNEHGANRFFARLSKGVFDPDEVTRRTHELADFIAAACRQNSLPAGRQVAVGFSNGANIAATLMQLRPETLAGAILLRPMVVLDTPALTNSLKGKRILIASGSQDPIVPADHPERLAALLSHGGAELIRQMSAAGHNLTAGDFVAAKTFLT
ncbi:MAG: alpha/beta hydrolase [Cephaloticoccus sp.]|nr:alpha/beta hydrolase [Cephaloticoccus sp.]MCF7760454.1 alpha/beta hydrolase [Cephaloticoccus sp.]